MGKRQKVVVVGAGFGGISVAKALETKAEVTLVNPSDRFVYLPLIHELVSDSETPKDVSKRLDEIFHGVQLVFGYAQMVDGNDLVLRDGSRIAFDKLVVAVGAEPNDFGIPGVRDHTFSFYSIQDAILANGNIKARASQVGGRKFKVLVAGASFTGIEMAGEIKVLLDKLDIDHEIHLVEAAPGIFPHQSQEFRDGVWDAVKRLGLDVKLNHRIVECRSDSMIVELNGERKELHADIMLWCAGARPKGIEGVDARVRMTMQSADRDDIFVLGDAALFPRELGVPKLAQTAEGQAPIVVHNIQQPENLKKYTPTVKGLIVSVGQKQAVAEIGGTVLTGQIPWHLKKRLYKTKIALY